MYGNVIAGVDGHHGGLVLLDLRMPLMDGYETAVTMRAAPGLQDTRILAVTGAARDDERLAAAGFDGYVQKPIDPDLLLDRVAAALRER
jgi:CheY-like chemotaxis protein